jgi:hypothetical protein
MANPILSVSSRSGIFGLCCITGADSKKKYFAVAVTTIIILASVLGVLFFTFGLRIEVSGMVIFRLWLWNIIGVASAVFGLFTVFEDHKA